MGTTGTSRRDRSVAATAALVVNAAIVYGLQGLLSYRDAAVDAGAPLQVVWIAAARLPDVALVPLPATATKSASARALSLRPAPMRATAATAVPPRSPVPDPAPSRPLSAVYLQQARQWAEQHPAAAAPADPFANRPVPLSHQAGSRFRLARPRAPADAVAMVGRLFGGDGYTTDDCALIRGRISGLVAAGDQQAVQQDLDYQRRHCL